MPSDHVKRLDFFGDLPSPAVEHLSERAEEVTLEAGDFVVHQHDEANDVFFLLSGTLQFLLRFEGVDDLLVGTTDHYGALVSWSAFRAPYRNTASVRCEEPCRLLKVPGAAFARVFEEDARVHYEVLARITSVVAERLDQTRDVLVLTPEQIPAEGAIFE